MKRIIAILILMCAFVATQAQNHELSGGMMNEYLMKTDFEGVGKPLTFRDSMNILKLNTANMFSFKANDFSTVKPKLDMSAQVNDIRKSIGNISVQGYQPYFGFNPFFGSVNGKSATTSISKNLSYTTYKYDVIGVCPFCSSRGDGIYNTTHPNTRYGGTMQLNFGRSFSISVSAESSGRW